MKKSILFLLLVCLLCVSLLGCQGNEIPNENSGAEKTIIELNEKNYWQYINMQLEADNGSAGEMYSTSCVVNGVLDFALYEDVVISFDVIYYTDGQSEEEYQSYTMRIACNAAGDAAFETTSLGITNVSVGKWLGIDGELVSFYDYNWKIHFKSISGNVIFSV